MAAWMDESWPSFHLGLTITARGSRPSVSRISSAFAPRTTRVQPKPTFVFENGALSGAGLMSSIWLEDCSTTSSRRWGNVRPRKGTSALGEPIREDSPAERMTAASIRGLAGYGGQNAGVLFDRLMCDACSAPTDGDKLGGDANGDFLRCERANLETHRRMNLLEAFGRDAFALERLVNRDHFTFAANHADITRLGVHRPSQYAHVVAMPARHDDQVARGIWFHFLERVLVGGVDLGSHWKSFAAVS